MFFLVVVVNSELFIYVNSFLLILLSSIVGGFAISISQSLK